jgi:hypothetical protein
MQLPNCQSKNISTTNSSLLLTLLIQFLLNIQPNIQPNIPKHLIPILNSFIELLALIILESGVGHRASKHTVKLAVGLKQVREFEL